MATNAASSDEPTPSAGLRTRRNGRLLWIIAALGLLYVLDPVTKLYSIMNGDWARDQERAAYEDRVLPKPANILGYLDGATINTTGAKPEPLTIRKDSISGLTLKREDDFFTLATFTLRTDRGRFEVEIFINHHPTDGTFVFDSYRVSKAVPR